MSNDIYCLPDMFAAVVLKPNVGKEGQRIQCIQWYKYSGQSIGEVKIDVENYGFQPRIVDVSKDEITILALDNSPNIKFPYKIFRQKYALVQSN